ncbi:MAG: hypothetical protein K2O34_13870 [Acetatifactor sp.]|nr:hypothetical protein [Acetatifactor sp.]
MKKNHIQLQKYLHIAFPVILFLFPFRHIAFGVEWWDTGYNYGNFVNMNRMDPMWSSGTFLGNALGHLFTLMPGGGTMMGLNVYTGLLVSILALMGYYFFVREVKLPEWIAFAGEFLAQCLCWCPTALLYNYLTYVLFAAGCIFLYMALLRTGRQAAGCYVLAGICLGVNVLTRFPNLAEMGMIAAVWAMAVIRRQKWGKTIAQTLWCLLGYILGLAAGVGIIAAFYGLEKYIGGITRLLSMPAEASDYSLYSMIYSQITVYRQTLQWMIYLLPVVIAGLVIYSILPDRRKGLGHLLCGTCMAATLVYLLHKGMFTLDYCDKASVFWWGAIWLVVIILSGIIVIFRRRFSDQDKLLCGMGILIVLITPLGSNNHLYSAINNLFLVAPWSLWMIRRFLIWLPGQVTLKGKLHIRLYALKLLTVCLLCVMTIQSVLFGAAYVFVEAGGGKNMHTKIENNGILRGMRTDPERARILEEITEYVKQQELGGRELILYGGIPSVCYYLEMPCAITAWPDLKSYNSDVMQTDLERIGTEIDSGSRQPPVLILNLEQGIYLHGGEQALQEKGMSAEEAQQYQADGKLQQLKSFADSYGYEMTFENDKLVLFQVP